jgi:hypothetical protein
MKQPFRVSRVSGLAGLFAATAGLSFAAPAGATFTGATNGNIVFAVASCNASGQALFSLNPAGAPPPSTCPGGTPPNFTQSTAGGIDSMPYFSSLGSTLYFASDRAASANGPGADGNFAIYQVAYPPAVTGSPGSQTDGALQITFPDPGSSGSTNDYAPTVDLNGNELAFIRCATTTGSTSCGLYVQTPIVGGLPALVTTAVTPLQPNATNGEASRPEIDPGDPSQIMYVGTDNHIHLVSLTSAFGERDLSHESGISGGQTDQYPDWNPAGTRIIFDRNQFLYVLDPTTPTATACELWGSADPGTEIEPIFAPTDAAASTSGNCNPSGNLYVWTKVGAGTNIVLDMGHSVNSSATLENLTANHLTNSQTTWQPIPLASQTPEVPIAAMLPFVGGFLLVGIIALEQRRRRKHPTVG